MFVRFVSEVFSQLSITSNSLEIIMTHQLVFQYQFTRQQFLAGVDGVSAEDGVKRLMPMNSISWIVGHLAQFDQVIWCEMAQGITISEAVKACANGKPARARRR